MSLLLNLAADCDRVHSLIEKISNLHSNDHYTHKQAQSASVATGAALKSAKELLGDAGGRIILFACTLSGTGCGKLASRLTPTLYNTEQEAAKMLSPATSFYRDLAKECVKSCITVDLFVAGSTKI